MYKKRLQKQFDHVARTYDAHALMQQEAGMRLLSRLDYIKHEPETILDLGAGTGFLLPHLRKRYPKARIVALDLSQKCLKEARKKLPRFFSRTDFVVGDADALPFAEQSFDMVISNMMLPWSPDCEITFQSIFRVLKREGLFMFTSLGVDTLKELRNSAKGMDDHVHVNTFYDMHDLGDLLLRVGFFDPVVDMERLTLTYKDLDGLFADLKATGSHVLNPSKKGLTTPRQWEALKQVYETHRLQNGLYPATSEIIFGHAIRPLKQLQRANVDGDVRIPFDEITWQGA